MIDRAHLGKVSEPRIVDVESGQLKFFAKATGESNPIYFDAAAAQAAGHPALPAPPSFAFSLNLAAPPVRGSLIHDIGIDMSKVLHGEQAFVHHRQIYAGDMITLTTTITDIYAKRGGALEFIEQTTNLVNQRGELCAESRTVTVVRDV